MRVAHACVLLIFKDMWRLRSIFTVVFLRIVPLMRLHLLPLLHLRRIRTLIHLLPLVQELLRHRVAPLRHRLRL